MGKSSEKKSGTGKVILIPSDFSPICDNAVSHGIELARFLGFHVHILHVTAAGQGLEVGGSSASDHGFEEHIKRYRNMAGNADDLKVDFSIKEGNLLKAINKTARELKAPVMILGTPGKKGLQHLYGSHALKVVLDAPCPVIVVQKRPFGHGYQRIVLPVSANVEAGFSIDWAFRLNRLFNAKLFLLQSPEDESAGKKHLKEITANIIKRLDDEKVSYQVDSAGPDGAFTCQVVSYADQVQADLILTTTLPGEDVHGFNFSAWNEQLMFNEAHVPVMCVNPAE